MWRWEEFVAHVCGRIDKFRVGILFLAHVLKKVLWCVFFPFPTMILAEHTTF